MRAAASNLWDPDAPAPPLGVGPRRCLCEHCDAHAELDGACAFCFVHCPPRQERAFAEAFCGLRRWRTHLLKAGLESEGCDPLVFYPLVLSLGSLARAEAWVLEQAELDARFRAQCSAEE